MHPLVILAAVKTGVDTFAAYNSQKAANRAAEFNAAMARYQAMAAYATAGVREKQANAASARGAFAAQRTMEDVDRIVGAQRAGYGASGVLVNTGSPVEVAVDTRGAGTLDALMQQYNADLEAWGLRAEAANLRTQGAMFEMESQAELSSRVDPWKAALPTALSGAVGVGKAYYGK